MLKLKASTSFAGPAAALLMALASPAMAQTRELTGTPALTGASSKVTGVLSAEETGPLDRTLELTLVDARTGEPLREFDVELTQELHVIATDSTFSTFVHEHAEANPHKNSGLAMIVAGGMSKLARGRHTRVTGTVGDVYLTLADEVLGVGLGKFPTATRRVTALLA